MNLLDIFKKRGEAVIQPKPPSVRSIIIPENDDLDDIEKSILLDGIGTAAFIVYEDAKGDQSERRITVRKIFESDAGMTCIGSFCHERQAYRTFRFDRILEWVDVDTGEVIEDTMQLWPLLQGLHEGLDPDWREGAALKRCHEGLIVLSFLARCDGHVHHTEVEVMNHYVLDECFDLDFDGDQLLDFANRLYPDQYVYQNALKKLGRSQDKLKRVSKYAVRLIEADGTIDDNETEFAMALKSNQG